MGFESVEFLSCSVVPMAVYIADGVAYDVLGQVIANN